MTDADETFDPETGEYTGGELDEPGGYEDEDGSDGQARSATRRAKKAMVDAAGRGDFKAVRAIGQTFIEVEECKERVKEERAVWKSRVDAAAAALRGAIESNDDATDTGARRKLNAIVLSFQDVEESEAGKKAALHLLIEEKKEAIARLKKQIEGARQLGLFD